MDRALRSALTAWNCQGYLEGPSIELWQELKLFIWKGMAGFSTREGWRMESLPTGTIWIITPLLHELGRYTTTTNNDNNNNNNNNNNSFWIWNIAWQAHGSCMPVTGDHVSHPGSLAAFLAVAVSWGPGVLVFFVLVPLTSTIASADSFWNALAHKIYMQAERLYKFPEISPCFSILQ